MAGIYKGFTEVQLRAPQRSVFDLSHEKRLTTRMGRITPMFFSEVLPNDTFKVESEVFVRFAPMVAPIMHEVNVYVHYFFVPMRLVWEDWEDFITGGNLGTETPPVPPNALISTIGSKGQEYLNIKSVADYLGVGTISDANSSAYVGTTIDLAPMAAAYKCFYDYYRDRNFQLDDGATPYDILPLASGTITDDNTLRKLFDTKIRGWERDRFTSALPWTQRGSEVLLPLQGTGTVNYLSTTNLFRNTGVNASAGAVSIGSAGNAFFQDSSTTPLRVQNIDSVNINTSDVSIDDFRLALALQSWKQRQALGGSRYSETIYAHFARRTSDGRLQEAEYLGGGKVRVKIGDNPTTAWSMDGEGNPVPPSNPSGRAMSLGNTNKFYYNSEEHGFVIGFMSVMPKPGYIGGSHRAFFSRNTFLDYPWPTFGNLGEQPVRKFELQTTAVYLPAVRSEQEIFGYQSQYADWKYIASTSHGDFKETMDYWHLDRKFSSTVALNSTFVTFDDALQDRIFAVEGVDTLWCQVYNHASVKRSLPYYGTPMLRG